MNMQETEVIVHIKSEWLLRSSMQKEGFSTFGVQNRNYGTHKPLFMAPRIILRITVGIIMEKDP